MDIIIDKIYMRSLVGSVSSYDVALLRDRLDPDSRFSMLLSDDGDRAKGKKVARLLAEIREDGSVVIRGMEVKREHRGEGLAKLITAVFCKFCLLTFGAYPSSLPTNKPGIAAVLTSLSFPPSRPSFPVYVSFNAVTGRTLMCHENRLVDLRPQYPKSVRRAQGIELVPDRPKGGRKVHVLTGYSSPPPPSSEDGKAVSGEVDEC
ncbi:hypothetical protein TrRE_jg7358 [Triparma retinervis]|uniref:Uncharacterized protein n=1 Tax=Triparma retinervis TaxID=2557542 RepID=A0A9W7AEC3_9STRA|nr:hypothetical protein TrRE_jg7358 [Triparma retinervis]